jgi:hypothetical protein
VSWFFLGIGCTLFAPRGPPAKAGTYTCASGPQFTVDANGVWDNGDNMNCGTAQSGSTLVLSCHGWPLTVEWRTNPDDSVDTDVIGRLYGDGGPVDHCTWAR